VYNRKKMRRTVKKGDKNYATIISGGAKRVQRSQTGLHRETLSGENWQGKTIGGGEKKMGRVEEDASEEGYERVNRKVTPIAVQQQNIVRKVVKNEKTHIEMTHKRT